MNTATQASDAPVEGKISSDYPDKSGHFGIYGGSFIAETLMDPVSELQEAYEKYRTDPEFIAEFEWELKNFVGRPNPLYHARRWSDEGGGAQIWLKREDLNHTGAHKINNTVGQALLARRMGKKRIIAETGAGQHGVATATVCARWGMECIVYMGEEDIVRQAPNVFRMKLLGAKVVPVTSGSRTLKDALNEAMRDWVGNVDDTFYIIGTAAGPHPYPTLVRDFNSVIGREIKTQSMEHMGKLPDMVVACVGGGSNAIGAFHPFLDDASVRLVGVEAGGDGLETGRHAAPLSAGKPGVLHGNRTYLMEDEAGQIIETHSVSAGLDYPGVGPEHAWLKDIGRCEYVAATDTEALDATHKLCRIEGIIPALESAHALAYAAKIAPSMSPDVNIVVNLSVKAGSDIIELGIPFSDPMADGPVIQAACERALKNNVSLVQIIELVKRFRQTDTTTAVVLMGYMNPVERLGYEKFATLASEAGVDGVLTVDMPPEEAEQLVTELNARKLDSIFLLSPTTPESRVKRVCEMGSGYIYYVSLKGVTGAANLDTEEVARKVNYIKSQASIPVAVGFGIRDASSAAAISETADAVVVGSVLVSIVEKHGANPEALHKEMFNMVNGMRIAMDNVQVPA